ncbi:hypothetical protein [Polyangium mundeleinium]|uniref:Uncharacterized protein n=1 Tax=Polyangium mundeleinium TaxID=2995306 RepID=A0ABT5EMS1_9BACT|nr:hypothetical protein [Polyangium mundeleinium]MDC0743135.1 hypothetical protein [Polyangium mundeleinium]
MLVSLSYRGGAALDAGLGLAGPNSSASGIEADDVASVEISPEVSRP